MHQMQLRYELLDDAPIEGSDAQCATIDCPKDMGFPQRLVTSMQTVTTAIGEAQSQQMHLAPHSDSADDIAEGYETLPQGSRVTTADSGSSLKGSYAAPRGGE
jgi:hypothetical protein